MPFKFTRISVPRAALLGPLQVAGGSLWAVRPGIVSQKTLRIDAKSYEVAEIGRPWAAGVADLLVGDQSIWYSDGMTLTSGRGDLYRVDMVTNQVTSVIGAVGSPFANGDGAVWAFNRRTRVISAIDTKNNQITTQLVTEGSPWFTFGAGSIWQLVDTGDVSVFKAAAVRQSLVRRIDPQSRKVIAEIPIGKIRFSDRLRFVDESVWILGEREKEGSEWARVPVAIRIDPKANAVAASIALQRDVDRYCAVHAYARSPVIWNGGIWISTFCSHAHRVPGVLVKIDLLTNQIVDEIALTEAELGDSGASHPELASGEGALWGLTEESVLRFGF